MREPYGVLFSIKNSNGKYTSCNGQSFEMAPKQKLGKKRFYSPLTHLESCRITCFRSIRWLFQLDFIFVAVWIFSINSKMAWILCALCFVIYAMTHGNAIWNPQKTSVIWSVRNMSCQMRKAILAPIINSAKAYHST